MNMPLLRFKQDDGSEFTNWEIKPIGDVLIIGSGKDYKHLSPGLIPVYGTGGYMLSVNDYLYEGESVCIGRKGTIDRPILLNGKFWTVDTLFYTHSFKNCLPKFIYACFQRIDWKNYNEASGVPSLSKSTIEKIDIQLPSLPEQAKITSFLKAVDEKITQLSQMFELLAQYKKGVIQQIFSQELRFKDDDGQDFPEWSTTALSSAALIVMGSSPQSEAYNDEGNGLPLIQGNADIKARKSAPRIYTTQITKECMPSDILLSVRAPVGTVAMSSHHACIGRGISAIRAKKEASQGFLYQWLLAYEPRWKSLSQGSTFEAVNSDDIKSLELAMPHIQEQEKIAKFLSAIDDKLSHTQDQLTAAKQYKQGLLQQMFV